MYIWEISVSLVLPWIVYTFRFITPCITLVLSLVSPFTFNCIHFLLQCSNQKYDFITTQFLILQIMILQFKFDSLSKEKYMLLNHQTFMKNIAKLQLNMYSFFNYNCIYSKNKEFDLKHILWIRVL